MYKKMFILLFVITGFSYLYGMEETPETLTLLTIANDPSTTSAQIESLVANGGDINWVNDDGGETALTNAIKTGDVRLVRAIINCGADINLADGVGMTPLMHAVENSFLEIAQLLVEKEANLTTRWNYDDFPHLNLVGFAVGGGLLEHRMHATSEEYSALKESQESRIKMLQWLVDDLHLAVESDEDTRLPLCCAAELGFDQIVKFLITHGANVNRPDNDHLQNTPLINAARYATNMETINVLIENGANVELRNAGQETALTSATYLPTPQIAKKLLLAGANPIEAKPDGTLHSPALSYAFAHGHPQIQKTLLFTYFEHQLSQALRSQDKSTLTKLDGVLSAALKSAPFRFNNRNNLTQMATRIQGVLDDTYIVFRRYKAELPLLENALYTFMNRQFDDLFMPGAPISPVSKRKIIAFLKEKSFRKIAHLFRR